MENGELKMEIFMNSFYSVNFLLQFKESLNHCISYHAIIAFFIFNCLTGVVA